MDADIRQRGFVTIVSVIVLLTVVVAAALTAFLAAWQSEDSQVAWSSALRAGALSDACAETARARLWDDPAYAGSESFTFDDGTCMLFPSVVGSSSVDISAEGIQGSARARTAARFVLSVDASGSVQTVETEFFRRVAEF